MRLHTDHEVVHAEGPVPGYGLTNISGFVSRRPALASGEKISKENTKRERGGCDQKEEVVQMLA